LQNGIEDNSIHIPIECEFNLPNNIENYTTIIICRNPYKRIISGFLDKYRLNGEFRKLYKNKPLSFSRFVNDLIKNKWQKVDYHHFTPQTTEKFNKNILLSKSIKFYDIENIDYNYIENLYNVKIPESLLHKKMGHERKYQINTDIVIDYNVYDINIDEYQKCIVDIKYFYNDEIKNKIFNFYKEDFDFFNENGMNYEL
jgi:hypothetical protein